jgi:hypothetical protein
VSLANTREVLYVVNRPGNAPSRQGAADWIDKAIDLVAPATDMTRSLPYDRSGGTDATAPNALI